MSLFCLLSIPLFYLLRCTIIPKARGSIWALFLGCAALVPACFVGPFIVPDGFGFSCWVSGFVDIVSLPVIVPLLVCLALTAARVIAAGVDYALFVLLWLMPMAAYRSISWSSPPSLILQVLVPVLWIAQAAGMVFFINCIERKRYRYIIVPLIPGIAALPVAAASSWWAFFSHRNILGFILLAATVLPMLISVVMDFIRAEQNVPHRQTGASETSIPDFEPPRAGE